jgi:hypothetical protein
MSEAEAMNIDERRKYIHKMWGWYRQGKKGEKGKLLYEIEAVTGMHIKAIIRLLNGRLSRKMRSRERGMLYGVEVGDTVQVTTRSLDYPCAERLQPNLVWVAQHLQMHGELRVGQEILEKLERVSLSALKQMLKQVGHKESKLALQQPRRH